MTDDEPVLVVLDTSSHHSAWMHSLLMASGIKAMMMDLNGSSGFLNTSEPARSPELMLNSVDALLGYGASDIDIGVCYDDDPMSGNRKQRRTAKARQRRNHR